MNLTNNSGKIVLPTVIVRRPETSFLPVRGVPCKIMNNDSGTQFATLIEVRSTILSVLENIF